MDFLADILTEATLHELASTPVVVLAMVLLIAIIYAGYQITIRVLDFISGILKGFKESFDGLKEVIDTGNKVDLETQKGQARTEASITDLKLVANSNHELVVGIDETTKKTHEAVAAIPSQLGTHMKPVVEKLNAIHADINRLEEHHKEIIFANTKYDTVLADLQKKIGEMLNTTVIKDTTA